MYTGIPYIASTLTVVDISYGTSFAVEVYLCLPLCLSKFQQNPMICRFADAAEKFTVTQLHSELPKLNGVLAILSVIGLPKTVTINILKIEKFSFSVP